jgi:S-DNA-T family DNA segregation ATPase FtsK/SpoIIIE
MAYAGIAHRTEQLLRVNGTMSGEIDEADLSRALEVLKSTQRASTSMLQRKLGWGYNRAARIMEELEARGVVGQGEGSRPREILRDTL